MAIPFANLSKSFPFARLFRQLEVDVETVVRVLKPGPLGIVEHKFSAEEIHAANATVKSAVKNWRMNANLERNLPLLKDHFN